MFLTSLKLNCTLDILTQKWPSACFLSMTKNQRLYQKQANQRIINDPLDGSADIYFATNILKKVEGQKASSLVYLPLGHTRFDFHRFCRCTPAQLYTSVSDRPPHRRKKFLVSLIYFICISQDTAKFTKTVPIINFVSPTW